ncbi:FHA domain-containing protein [Chroococcidiopsis cubana CCALA 043]|nr:FHA domain-containing protein [Chroococcidiopsis cubana CCALA 043]
MANRCPEPSCKHFDRPTPDEARVCPMCGTPVGTVDESQDSSMSGEQFPLPQLPNLNSSRPQMRLSHSSGGDFYLRGEAGIIGRRDRDSGKVPEIDLSGIPNEEIVSRSHARLYWDKSQQSYMIVDSSRNGTYLNGNLLKQGVPYRLNHGDELQLGQNQMVCLKVWLV